MTMPPTDDGQARGAAAVPAAGAAAGAAAVPAAGAAGEAAERGLRVSLPGDWIFVDTGVVERWKTNAGTVSPALSGALGMLEGAAAVFSGTGALLSAVLLERGSTEALATMACFFVGTPALPDDVDLAAQVAAAPPADAVDGTLAVDEDGRAGGLLRARCLRRSVLEVPTRESVSLAVEYFLPVAGGGMVVAAFSTPNAAKEEEYLDLFSSIAASIEIG